MICQNCQNELPEGAWFCHVCGAAFTVYAAPEFFLPDPGGSGLYYRTDNVSDPTTGETVMWVTWFNPTTGAYEQVSYPAQTVYEQAPQEEYVPVDEQAERQPAANYDASAAPQPATGSDAYTAHPPLAVNSTPTALPPTTETDTRVSSPPPAGNEAYIAPPPITENEAYTITQPADAPPAQPAYEYAPAQTAPPLPDTDKGRNKLTRIALIAVPVLTLLVGAGIAFFQMGGFSLFPNDQTPDEVLVSEATEQPAPMPADSAIKEPAAESPDPFGIGPQSELRIEIQNESELYDGATAHFSVTADASELLTFDFSVNVTDESGNIVSSDFSETSTTSTDERVVFHTVPLSPGLYMINAYWLIDDGDDATYWASFHRDFYVQERGQNELDRPLPYQTLGHDGYATEYVTAEHLRGDEWMNYTFLVIGTESESVWGDWVYTDDSNIAAAAVHAGMIQSGEAAYVTIQILPGQDSYDSSTRNGVTSGSYGKWDGSYMFVDAFSPDGPYAGERYISYKVEYTTPGYEPMFEVYEQGKCSFRINYYEGIENIVGTYYYADGYLWFAPVPAQSPIYVYDSNGNQWSMEEFRFKFENGALIFDEECIVGMTEYGDVFQRADSDNNRGDTFEEPEARENMTVDSADSDY